MRNRKPSPQEMALATVLGLISFERAREIEDEEHPSHSTDNPAIPNAGIHASEFSPSDVCWMKAMGIEL